MTLRDGGAAADGTDGGGVEGVGEVEEGGGRGVAVGGQGEGKVGRRVGGDGDGQKRGDGASAGAAGTGGVVGEVGLQPAAEREGAQREGGVGQEEEEVVG